MSRAADRRARQAQIEAEFVEDQNQRPNEPGVSLATSSRCPGSFGPCDYSMKGSDGVRRCWYCCRKKPATP